MRGASRAYVGIASSQALYKLSFHHAHRAFVHRPRSFRTYAETTRRWALTRMTQLAAPAPPPSAAAAAAAAPPAVGSPAWALLTLQEVSGGGGVGVADSPSAAEDRAAPLPALKVSPAGRKALDKLAKADGGDVVKQLTGLLTEHL